MGSFPCFDPGIRRCGCGCLMIDLAFKQLSNAFVRGVIVQAADDDQAAIKIGTDIEYLILDDNFFQNAIPSLYTEQSYATIEIL